MTTGTLCSESGETCSWSWSWSTILCLPHVSPGGRLLPRVLYWAEPRPVAHLCAVGEPAPGGVQRPPDPRSADSPPSLSTNPRCLESSEELISASAAVVPSTSPRKGLSSSHRRESPPGLLGTLCLGFLLLPRRPPSPLLALGTRSPSLTLHPKSPCVLGGLKPIFTGRKASATQSHHTCKT